MTTLLSPLPRLVPAASGQGHGEQKPATPPRVAPQPRLSRGRGGTFSSTVDIIRFDDGETARTDLIRLTPGVAAYSLDFGGLSPRQLSHYREASWAEAPGAARYWRHEIAHVLAESAPRISAAELTHRLRQHGYPLGTGVLREHEIIAATQAAIWQFTNGRRLDTQPQDEPLRAVSRVAGYPGSRVLETGATSGMHWTAVVPAGATARLELVLPAESQLGAFRFMQADGSSSGRLSFHLESSRDGARWARVSRSAVRPAPGHREVCRRLGLGATLRSVAPSGQQRGYRHYALVAQAPGDETVVLDLRDLRVELAGAARFRNNERVVYLYDYLTSGAVARPPAFAREHRPPVPEPRPRVAVKVLIGARTPDGPGVFTPLVSSADLGRRPLPSPQNR
ncbi:MAG TPA: TQXA domain-containing protein [Arachnia sp.]|mgnify:CR=1 FL=1|nr:TQXA domain-containing protein [Arachnia sp.]HMT87476.1 TQXA domain-containing protein [Arachnia sp.]